MVNIPKNIEQEIFSGADPAIIKERFHKEIIALLPLDQQVDMYAKRIKDAISEGSANSKIHGLTEKTRDAIHSVL
jgi:hypothetical protein